MLPGKEFDDPVGDPRDHLNRKKHEKYMKNTWKIHGKYMENTWKIHEKHVRNTWKIHVKCM